MAKEIDIKGIVHNLSRNEMVDGMCEDIVNLRFKDGSWRPTSDGRKVFSMKNHSNIPAIDVEYSHIFVHANVYHHVLGVRSGSLYWFADIDYSSNADGVFVPLTNAIKITSVTVNNTNSNFYICQTGHLLTIIDDAGGFEYALFNEKTDQYKVLGVDENGGRFSSNLYPFGGVHFNLDTSVSDNHTVKVESEGGDMRVDGEYDWNTKKTSDCYMYPDQFHNNMITAFGMADEKNIFTRPFMAMVAVKLYDGSYAFASQPVLLWPYQRYAMNDAMPNTDRTSYSDSTPTKKHVAYMDYRNLNDNYRNPYWLGAYIESNNEGSDNNFYPNMFWNGQIQRYSGRTEKNQLRFPSYSSYAHGRPNNQTKSSQSNIYTFVRGADILLNIENIDIIKSNSDLFTGIGIFITPQVQYLNTSDKGIICRYSHRMSTNGWGKYWYEENLSYCPLRRNYDDIKYDLENSSFFLLREYTIDELESLNKQIKVDLSSDKYKNVLKNIAQQQQFTSEATERKSYIPKVAYSYNQRLHIANYTSSMYNGHPYATVNRQNYCLAPNVNDNAFALPNVEWLRETQSNIYQNPNTQKDVNRYDFISIEDGENFVTQAETDTILSKVKNFVCIKTHIKTEEGSIVNRLVKSYDPSKSPETYNYVEDFPALLTYPDARAEKIEILITVVKKKTNGKIYAVQYKTINPIELKSLTYLNVAFYMSSNLQPIKLEDTSIFEKHETEINSQTTSLYWSTEDSDWSDVRASETQPNCMKVSSTQNPFIFPYENTYKIGATEILALCSNAVAVGTGQTGSAPLYVFCKDGLYACFVDTSGQMAYPNARILARDVINQYNRAVPVDKGVVFTTDRGLMCIAGEQVEEIGMLAEGDFAKFYDTTSIDYTKIAHNAYILNTLASLSPSSINTQEFKEYLKGAIVNYNHNEFELMVSNPNKSYTWIMDKHGNWSRRDYKAKEYINNYPTSYRLGEDGVLYQVDKDSDGNNGVFMMTNVIKLDTLGFKQLKRAVARGHFKQNQHTTTEKTYIPKSLDSTETKSVNGEIEGLSETSEYLTYTYNIDEEVLDTKTITASANKDHTIKMSFDGQHLEILCGELISNVWSQECTIDSSKKSDVGIAFVLFRSNGDEAWRKEYHSVPLKSNIDNGLEINIPVIDEIINVEPNQTYTLKLIVCKSVVYLKSIYGLVGSLDKGEMVLSASLDGSLNGADIIKPATRIIDESDTDTLIGIGSSGQTISNLIYQSVPLTLNVNDGSNQNGAVELLSNGYIHVKGDSLFELEISGDQPLVVELHTNGEIDLVQNSFTHDDSTFYTTKKPTAGLYLVSQNGNIKHLLAESYNNVMYYNDPGETPCDDFLYWKFDNFTYYGWLESGTYRLEFRTYVCFEFEEHPVYNHKLTFEHNSGNVPMSLRVTSYFNNEGELDEDDTNHIQIGNATESIVEEDESSSGEVEWGEVAKELPVEEVEDIIDGTTVIGKKYHIQCELSMPIIEFTGGDIEQTGENIFTIPEKYNYVKCGDDTGDASGFFVGIQAYNSMLSPSVRTKMINNANAPTRFNSCIFKILTSGGEVVYQSEADRKRYLTEYGCGRKETDRANEVISETTPISGWEDIAEPDSPYLIARIPFDFNDPSFYGEGLILEPGRYKCVLEIDAEISIKSTDDYSKGIESNGKGFYLMPQDDIDEIPSEFEGYNGGYIDTINVQFAQLPEEDDTDYVLTIDEIDSLDSIHSVYTPAHWQDGVTHTYESHLGFYVFGSYDGRKWGLLGGNEKRGEYNDIGALIERSDCKYFRIVLAGQIDKESRFDFMEIEGDQSILSNKIR